MRDDRHEEKQRKCLRCRKMFRSKHAGNRICSHCVAHPPNVSGLRRVALDPNILEGRNTNG